MERLTRIDNAKAILIVLVVFGHMIELELVRSTAGAALFLLIYLFHMPAFAAVSGYLARPDAYSVAGARRLSGLLLAYAVFQPLMAIAMWGSIPHSAAYVLLHPLFTMWWVLSLVWWRLMLPLFARGASARAAVLSVVAATALSLAFGRLPIDGAVLSFSRTFVFLPFFVAGYRASQRGWKLPHGRGFVVAAAAIMLATLAVLYVRFDFGLSPWLMGAYAQPGFTRLQTVLTGLKLAALSGVLVVSFFVLVPSRTLAITTLGSTTLSVFVWHGLALQMLIATGLAPKAAGTWLAACLTTAAMVLVFGAGPVPKLTNRLIRGPSRAQALGRDT